MPDDLMDIYERARGRVGSDVWSRSSAHEQTQAFYQEFRAQDAVHFDRGRPRPESGDPMSSEGMPRQHVRLRLIGRMEAWTVSGENILPTGRKTRGLLAFIALTSPRPALRPRLAELLWSRRSDEQARASLRQEIQLLSRALAPTKTEVIRVTRDHITLMPDVAWVDVQEILRPAINRQAALSLVDGELLEDLDGIDPAFDAWLASERERIRDRARAMAETLLRCQTAPPQIIAASQRLLQIDRTHEEAWRAMMRAHADLGERGMAIQAYERCRTVLADMLDATPSRETQALLSAIRGPSGKHAPARQPGRPPPSANRPPLENIRESSSDPRPRDGPRIGVLPLRGVGLSEVFDFLGPGIASEITTALSRFRWLSIISSNRVASEVRDGLLDPARRHAHGLDYLLDGAIQRNRSKFRVTLRLLDLREDNQVVWARRFEHPSDDPLAIQEAIAAEAAAQISPVVLMSEAKRAAGRLKTEPSARDLISLAVPNLLRLERAGFMRAGALLEQAVAGWSENAFAHAWSAAWHLLLLCQYWAADRERATNEAIRLADHAVALDPSYAGAFSIAGHIRAVVQHRPLEATALHDRALALNPNWAGGWALSAVARLFLGRLKEAEQLWSRFQTLSPLDPLGHLYEGWYALLHVLNRDYQAAVTAGRSITQLSPGYCIGYKALLAALGHLGHTREAAMVLTRLRTLEPNATVVRTLATFPLDRQADIDHFAAGLRLAGLT